MRIETNLVLSKADITKLMKEGAPIMVTFTTPPLAIIYEKRRGGTQPGTKSYQKIAKDAYREIPWPKEWLKCKKCTETRESPHAIALHEWRKHGIKKTGKQKREDYKKYKAFKQSLIGRKEVKS